MIGLVETVVALAEVKAQLRVEANDEDAYIVGLIRSAVDMAEAFLSVRLLQRSVTMPMVILPETWTRLGDGPVVGDPLLEDADGAALSPADVLVRTGPAGDVWVRSCSGRPMRATASYTAGLAADWNGIPHAIRQGVTRCVAHLFTHRDDAIDGGLPRAVTMLWRPWRRVRLGAPT